MKITVLSIRQPWASIVIHSSKWCEVRSQRSRFTGELWIHASETWSGDWERPDDPKDVFGFPCPTGVILGRANMLGCWPLKDINGCRDGTMPDDEELWLALKDVANEPKNFFGWEWVPDGDGFGYLLTDRVPLKSPIQAKGRLGFWQFEVDEDRLELPLITLADVRKEIAR